MFAFMCLVFMLVAFAGGSLATHDAQTVHNRRAAIAAQEEKRDSGSSVDPQRATFDSSHIPPWNVLLLTIDSCNTSRLSLYGNRVQTTPNLDSWAQQATVFERAYSVSVWTAPGLLSIFSGVLPGVHGVDSRDRYPQAKLPTLIKIFQQLGYQVPNLNFFTFVSYFQNLALPAIDRSYFTQNDGDELLNYLDRHADRPFFVWYHTTKVHLPYHPPDGILQKIMSSGLGPQEKAEQGNWEEAFKAPGIQAVRHGAIVPKGSVTFRPEDRQALLALYDAALYNMDVFLGRVFDKLRQKGIEDRTLVIVTADHGEELLEHGFVGHASTSLNAKLYEEVTHIPLVFRLPGQQSGGRVSSLVQQIDIAPTILDVMHIPIPPITQGVSLKQEVEVALTLPPGSRHRVIHPAIFLESSIAGNQTTKEREDLWLRGIRTDQFKYIQELQGTKITGEYLFDLRQDPREEKTLAASHGSEVAHFRQQVTAMSTRNETLRQQYLAAEPSPKTPLEKTKDCPVVEMPGQGQKLDYHAHTGAMLFQWTGDPEADYVIQYDVGEGDHHLAGQYEAKGNHQILGPFPPDLWLSLKAWHPFKMRVSYKGTECWSAWTTFSF